MDEKITMQVTRYRPDKNTQPVPVDYEVPLRKEWTVLDGLNHIKAERDETLSFRWSCRMGICGSCGMNVDGEPRLTCGTFLSDYAPGPVRVEPLANFPVVKDLVVDMKPHWDKFRQVQPYLQPSGEKPQREYLVPNQAMVDLNQVMACIQCGACVMACTSLEVDENFIGPAALAKAYRFTGDPRDAADKKRFKMYNEYGGVWDCTHCFYCVEVCPKGVAPMDQIMKIREQMVEAGVKNSAGYRHEEAFLSSVKTAGRLNEATMVPKSLGLLNPANLGEMPGALKLLRAGKLINAFKEGMLHRIPSAKSLRNIFRRVEKSPEVVAAHLPRKGEAMEETQ